MKCEKCGKEANFYYSSTINGQHEEHCMCADCAKEAGFAGAFDFRPAFRMEPMFAGMFDDFFGGDFFAAPRRMLSAFDSFGLPFHDMMTPMLTGRSGAETQQTQPMSEAETKVPADAGEEVRARREREALRQELEEAVKAENFERAIELRDQLKKLEA